jgi:hypothetical protein
MILPDQMTPVPIAEAINLLLFNVSEGESNVDCDQTLIPIKSAKKVLQKLDNMERR